MWIRSLTLMGAAISVLTVASSTASATALPITDTGDLLIANATGSLLGLTSVPICLNWGGGSTCVAGTTHQMAVSGVSNLFSTAPSAIDQIRDLTGLGSVVDFETVLGAGALAGLTINFDLTSIPTNGPTNMGNCASNAAFNSCTPAFSPFTLTEDSTGTQVTLQFSTLMAAYAGSSATGATAYRGVFDTQYSGSLTGSGACVGLTANITNILSCEAAGGTVASTWSASESPIPGGTVPEPVNTPLAAIALVAMGWYARRLRRA